jgi:hypothetical protein
MLPAPAKAKRRMWTAEEESALEEGVLKHGEVGSVVFAHVERWLLRGGWERKGWERAGTLQRYTRVLARARCRRVYGRSPAGGNGRQPPAAAMAAGCCRRRLRVLRGALSCSAFSPRRVNGRKFRTTRLYPFSQTSALQSTSKTSGG